MTTSKGLAGTSGIGVINVDLGTKDARNEQVDFYQDLQKARSSGMDNTGVTTMVLSEEELTQLGASNMADQVNRF